jgi:uncharacterized protein
MPNGWFKVREPAKLADMRAHFEVEIALGELPGIPEEFSLAEGLVRATLHFGRERDLAVAHVTLSVVLTPVCQRCLGAMRLPIAADSHLALVESEAQAATVPEEFETFLAADGHCTLAALVAEELLLALPIAPRHGAAERCGAEPAVAATTQACSRTAETQRPFADLRRLMDRDKS